MANNFDLLLSVLWKLKKYAHLERDIELYKSGEKSGAFLANNLYFLK